MQNIWVDTGVKEYCIFYFFLNKENYKVFHDIHYKEMLNVNNLVLHYYIVMLVSFQFGFTFQPSGNCLNLYRICESV